MPNKKNIILDSDAIDKKISRIAYEIYEANYEEKEIILIGIYKNGLELATRLKLSIENISKIKVRLISLTLNKVEPLKDKIKTDLDLSIIKGKTVILVDDVAHSGKTLLYAMIPMLEFEPLKIQIAVLVDRKHKKFPVAADFTGLLLSTNVHEMVTVSFGKNEVAFIV